MDSEKTFKAFLSTATAVGLHKEIITGQTYITKEENQNE